MTLDVLTLTEAKQALNISASVTTHDDEIARYVSAVSARLDDLCGPVVAREVVELHNGGGMFLRPRVTPVESVTKLEEFDRTTGTELDPESNQAKPAAGYLVDDESPHNVRIVRRSNGEDSTFPAGRRNIELTYEAGRFPDTDTVDAKFKQAAGLVLLHLWRPAASAWGRAPEFSDAVDQPSPSPVAPWAVPRAVKELLADELRPPAGA